MKIELVKSPIGQLPKIRKTIRALGLRKMHQVKEIKDTKSVKGMVHAVSHLVKVVET